jgi:hypothetical protein
MMLDELIVSMLLLVFVGVVTAIRLKARAQRAKTGGPGSKGRGSAARRWERSGVPGRTPGGSTIAAPSR